MRTDDDRIVIAVLSRAVTLFAAFVVFVTLTWVLAHYYKEAFVEPDSWSNRRSDNVFWTIMALIVPGALIGFGRLLSNMLFQGGQALIFRDGDLVYLPPFSKRVSPDAIVRVEFAKQTFSKDGPDAMCLFTSTGRMLTIDAFLFSTPFAELTARLRALGVPVPEDPPLNPPSEPRSPSPP